MNTMNFTFPSRSFAFDMRVGTFFLAGLLAFACVGLSTASAQFGDPDSRSGPVRRVGERPVTERPATAVVYRLDFLKSFNLCSVRKMAFETGSSELVVANCEMTYSPEMPFEASVKLKIEMVSDPSVPVVTVEDKISLTPEWDIDLALSRDFLSLIGPWRVAEDRFNDVLNARGFGDVMDSELIDFKSDPQFDSYRIYSSRVDAELLVFWAGTPRHRIVEEMLRY